jgi:hypothetical protein
MCQQHFGPVARDPENYGSCLEAIGAVFQDGHKIIPTQGPNFKEKHKHPSLQGHFKSRDIAPNMSIQFKDL